MVKIAFRPNDNVVESIVSKRVEKNLNPFLDFQPLVEQTQATGDYIKVKDIIGLENCAYVLHNWYTCTSSKNGLLIIGPTGCGKTTLVESYCKENGILLYSVKTSETTKTKKDLLRDIFSFSEYSSTSFFIKRQNNDKKLILIDEYQNGQSDLLSITDIHNLHLLRSEKSRIQHKKELKLFLNDLDCPFTIPPILIISSDSKGSKLSELKKLHEVYYINEIPFYTIKTWINSFKLPFSETVLIEIIKKCKSDKRIILNTLNFLKDKNQGVEKFITTFYKDTQHGMFDFLSILFENPNITDIFKIYETDGFMISNLVHENYLEYTDDMDLIANAADAISIGETLFSDTYESSRTFIPDAHCLHSLYIPSFYCKGDKINKNIRTCCINNRYNIYLNNLKIIAKINSLSIFDILYIKKFLNHSLVKTKILTVDQELFLKNIIGSTDIEKLELIYKHFSEFGIKEAKTKNFTLKFKEKIKKIILT